MLDCQAFLDLIKSHEITFSAGVPDSLLKDFCSCIADSGTDIIAANEGGAIALAAGHHLATGKIPFVYMQNSGFGNAINPLTSLTDPEVYSIPILLMIGWRGEPGVKDEPQHIKQGRINEAMLKALEIPYAILSSDYKKAKEQLEIAMTYMRIEQAPYVLLVRAGVFAPYRMKNTSASQQFEMNREAAIVEILSMLSTNDIVVSTTGKSSREVFEKRKNEGMPHDSDFLTVGCMGHASQIALGIALEKKNNQVYCLDGDGAFLMHMGAAAIIGDLRPSNFKHIVINNGSHDSVGGQPTVALGMDLCGVAISCGYRAAYSVDTKKSLKDIFKDFESQDGPLFLEIKTRKGARENLGRPTISPIDNKRDFMKNLNSKS